MNKKEYRIKIYLILLYISVNIILFLFLSIILSINLKAEPVMSFDEIQSFKLNLIKLSNLNYQNKAVFKIFAYTYENKKELIFNAKLDYYIKNFLCYFYCSPDFARIELVIEFDSKDIYNYEYKVKTNKYAEKDFINYTFNEKYFYEIIDPQAKNTYYKILDQYNPNYYNLMSTTILHYFDKKNIDKNSIFIFVLMSLVSLAFMMSLADKKIFTIVIFIIIFMASTYAIFLNDQNFILKAYLTNPVDQSNNVDAIVNPANLLSIPIVIESLEKNENFKILGLNLIKSKTKITKIYQQDYDFEFSKLFFQNSKIPLLNNINEFLYFTCQPQYLKIIYENDQYYVLANKILLFGRIKDEK